MTTLICRAALGLFAAAAVASLAACGSDEASGGSDTAPASASGPGGGGSGDGEYRTRALEAGRGFAQCARAHGSPNFPDPAIQDGVLAFPNVSKADLETVGQACNDEARQIPYPPQQEIEPPSEEIYQIQLRYARCARENGLPDYPDPNRDGTDEFRGTEVGRVLYLANLGIGGLVPQAHIDVRSACAHIEEEWRAQDEREQNGG